MMKAADKAESLRADMKKLEETKIPTEDYKEISVQIEKAEQKFNRLLEKQEQMQREGKDNGTAWQRLNDQMDEIGNEIRYAKGELQDLVDTGKAFTLGSGTDAYVNMANQLKYTENNLSTLAQQHEVLETQQKNISTGYKKWGDIVKKSFSGVYNVLKKANDKVKSFGTWIKNIAQRHMPSLRKETERTSGTMSRFGKRLKSLLSGIFIFNVISSGFRSMFAAIKEGYENLYKGNKKFENSVDNLKASALTLKNALAAAFSPLVQIAIPYIQKVIEWMTKLADSVGQFIAAITGQKTYLRAVKQTTAAIKEQTKAENKQLSSLDKLNNLTSSKDSSGDTGSGGAAFEEVPIDSKFQDIADKVREILDKIKGVLKKLFDPIKEAWDRVGNKVIKAWKYALGEVWKLIKDIGRDFLEVWNQEATIRMLEDVLRIIQHIGTTIGNLARQFRLAWNENDVGLHILENIRDIIAIIIHNIQVAAAYTALWAGNLDFYPLLDKLNQWLESFKPVVEAVTGILLDFYTKVILPLSKWVLEKGLPDLLQVFIDFNNKVDWESLRENLAEFWAHLEPFAETVGAGLIEFIDRCAQALADFINSQEFKDFLVEVEEWMDGVSPDDVADALEKIAKGIIGLKVALVLFKVVSPIISILSKVIDLLSTRKALKAIENLGKLGTEGGSGGGIFSKLSGGFSLGEWLTADASLILGAGDAATIAAYIGSALIAAFAAWMAGNWTGKQLGALLFPDMSEEYENFSWLGEGGFFDQLFGGVDFSKVEEIKQCFEDLRTAWVDMHTDFENNPVIAIIMGIMDPLGLLYANLKNLKDNAQETFDTISNALQTCIDSWKQLFEGLGVNLEIWWSETWLSDALWNFGQWWDEKVAPWFTQEKWSELWNNIKQSAITKWNEIKQTISNSITEIHNNIVNKLNAIKGKWTNVWNGFKGVVSSALNGVKSVVQPILSWIEGKISSLNSTINGLKQKASGLFGGGSSKTSRASAYAYTPAAAAVANLDIPGYATGQVIPKTMKKHLAYLGDNNQETEVVSPLSTIQQALREEMASNGFGGGDITVRVPVEIDGNVIMEIVKKLSREELKRTGKPAFT